MSDIITSIPLAGSIINAIAVIVLGSVGLVIGSRLPERIARSLISALGACTIALGLGMTIGSGSVSLRTIVAMVAGTAVGEALDIESRFERFAERTKARFKVRDARFVEAFVSTSLIYCVGSMAILGAIEEGMGAFPSIYLTKSLMDGISGVVFAATLGIGVIFSSASVFVYQGALTLCAEGAKAFVTPAVVDSMTSVGGIMIVCIGLNLLGVTKIRTSCQLPAILFAVAAGALS